MESLVYSLIHHPFLRIDFDDSWHVVVSLVYRFFSIEMRSLEGAFLLSTLHIQYIHMQSKAETESVSVAVSFSSPSSLFLILAFNFSAVFIIRSAGYYWMGVHVLLHVRLLPVCISNWSQRSAPPPAHRVPLIFPFLGSLNNYFVARESRLLWGLAFILRIFMHFYAFLCIPMHIVHF